MLFEIYQSNFGVDILETPRILMDSPAFALCLLPGDLQTVAVYHYSLGNPLACFPGINLATFAYLQGPFRG